MPEARRPMNLSAEQYRALSLLAEAGPGGVTEAVMISQGLAVTPLIDLVRAGYAWVTKETVRAFGRKIEIARVEITEAGRRAIAH